MYTNQTTHYAIPLPLGTDLTTPMDYNEAAQAIDTAVWGATQDAATATSDAANAVETANGAAEDVGTLGGRVNTLEATVETQGNAIVGLVNTVTNQGTAIGNKFNSVAVADAYSPTSIYSVGDVVTFEGNRYKCITAVTTGEPFDVDKWQGEDIQTVIDGINSDLSDLDDVKPVEFSYTADGVLTMQALLGRFYNQIKDEFNALPAWKKRNAKFDCSWGTIPIAAIGSATLEFYGIVWIPDNHESMTIKAVKMQASNCSFFEVVTDFTQTPSVTTITSLYNEVPTEGTVFKIYC